MIQGIKAREAIRKPGVLVETEILNNWNHDFPISETAWS
jgi:hypothetical protein